MARSEAQAGYGAVLEIALEDTPDTKVYIRECTSHTPPSFTDSEIEVSHMQSPNRAREYVAGMSDSGECTHEGNYVPGSATDLFLRSIQGKNVINTLTFPTGASIIYGGIRKGYETNIPLEDRMGFTLTMKVSGQPAPVPVAAPRNLVAPTISGTPKVGVPLTLDHGDWAGAHEWEYQWQADGVDITDATLKSFVPTATQTGDTITCEVTAKNGSFDTTVETAATAAVAA